MVGTGESAHTPSPQYLAPAEQTRGIAIGASSDALAQSRSILGVLRGQQQQLLLLLHRVVSRAMEREEEEGAGGGDAMEEEVAVKVDNLPRGADSLRLWIS